MGTSRSFVSAVVVGYVVALVLLGGALLATVRHLDASGRALTAKLRADEERITRIEKLRANGEVVVAAGRGYIISGDGGFLTSVREGEHEFKELLDRLRGDIPGRERVTELERVALAEQRFRAAQDALFAARLTRGDRDELAARFESELMPLRRELATTLNDLSAHEEAQLRRAYEQAEREHDAALRFAYAISALGLVLTIAAAGYCARILTRMYARERDALEHARQAIAARDEVLGVVAHDLRNPTGAIIMKAATMRERAAGPDTRAEATFIENVAMRMDHMIKGLVDVASFEAGSLSIERSTCSVVDLVDETIALFEANAGRKSVRLVREVEPTTLSIFADRERVLQVLANLVGNAVKFAPHGSAVIVAASRQAELVRLDVVDRGPGIAADDLQHLFDRFWTKGRGARRGTGLGLFIAKQIVGAHGGRIWVETSTPKGSKFSFTLPEREAAEAPTAFAMRRSFRSSAARRFAGS
jgi:signal transduction histidine kinase